jgi:6-phosphofructo-2-kinase/fructose-2,6-biphosphatase
MQNILFFSEELPYINVPLHTLIKITIDGYNCHMECTKLNVECVDTYRKQPKVHARSEINGHIITEIHFNRLK